MKLDCQWGNILNKGQKIVWIYTWWPFALRPFIHGKEAAKNDFESLVYTPDMEAISATSIKSYS